VLAQCPALAHLDLRYNELGDAGTLRLTKSWSGPKCGLFLDESDSVFGLMW
jgi:hypothetical protein